MRVSYFALLVTSLLSNLFLFASKLLSIVPSFCFSDSGTSKVLSGRNLPIVF